MNSIPGVGSLALWRPKRTTEITEITERYGENGMREVNCFNKFRERISGLAIKVNGRIMEIFT